MPVSLLKSKLLQPSTDHPENGIQPFWQTTDGSTVRLYLGDVIDRLRDLPDQSVQCVVTSPPYWGLRDYKTAQWVGGKDPNCLFDYPCDHLAPPLGGTAASGLPNVQGKQDDDGFTLSKTQPNKAQYAHECLKCGAQRVDQQLGSERTPQEFVKNMVRVFAEVKRVLRDDGVLWLNLGDSYASGGRDTYTGFNQRYSGTGGEGSKQDATLEGVKDRVKESKLPAGNLVGIPWRVALALQADGWILRQDIIWHKLSPMPESVQNRCTKSHEYIFLLSKQQRYYYDADAIREITGSEVSEEEYEDLLDTEKDRGEDWYQRQSGRKDTNGTGKKAGEKKSGISHPNGRNKRSVWSVSLQGYDGAHFATYPIKLITPCVLAGTSAHGSCADCGAPWKRVTEKRAMTRERPNDYTKRKSSGLTGGAYHPDGQSPHSNAREVGNTCSNSVAGVEVKTIRWEPTCTCYGTFEKREGIRLGYGSYHDHTQDGVEHGLRQGGNGPSSNPGMPTKEFKVNEMVYESNLPLDEHPVVPCTVLDPFIGSGTSCVVALSHGRRSIGIDLSEAYLRNNAVPRIEGELMSRPAMSGLIPREDKPDARVKKTIEFAPKRGKV